MTTSDVSWQNWSPEARVQLLAKLRQRRWCCDQEDCDGLPHRGWNWKHARTAQRPPEGDWRAWYLQGGRGAGKTRTGSETLGRWIVDGEPNSEWAIVAPTFGAARDICVESEGGLLRALGGFVMSWTKSVGQLELANGSTVFLDGADDGALRIQGHNLSGVWADEIGLWAHGWKTAWMESIQFALRKPPGRIVATGTPKAGHPLVRMLLNDERVKVTRMRTLDNADNLDAHSLAELIHQYGGTRLGRQELDAEFIEDVEGALWSIALLESVRVGEPPPMQRIVVAVDPNMSNSEAANEAGVIVCGLGRDKLGYVLADRTTAGGPRVWAQAAVSAYHEFEADRIVAEKNAGGEMVRMTIETVDPDVPIKLVHASQGKRTRAEPIATMYEGDHPKVRHVSMWKGRPVDLVDLEAQMCTWTPDAKSPDRMDALVWGLTELMIGRKGGPMTILNPNGMNPGGVVQGGIIQGIGPGARVGYDPFGGL